MATTATYEGVAESRPAHPQGPDIDPRSELDAALAEHVAAAAATNAELTFVLVAVDGLDELTAAYGDQTREEVLRRAEAALRLACRSTDKVVRHGNDGFAVLLPATPRQQSFVAANLLRDLVAEAGRVLRITVSAGISNYPAHAHSPAGVLIAAEEALETVKRTGGNHSRRSIRGALYRSNERRKAMGKSPVLPKADRGPSVAVRRPQPVVSPQVVEAPPKQVLSPAARLRAVEERMAAKKALAAKTKPQAKGAAVRIYSNIEANLRGIAQERLA
jgi:diguanylate cyclase (GGDEF)-like protein